MQVVVLGCQAIYEILALQALALQARGDTTQAQRVLEHALTSAEPEGYIRTFVDEGAPMAALLHAAQARGIVPDYTTKLLAAFPIPDKVTGYLASPSALQPLSPSLVEPLSERELEVLRLVAAGLSNQAIAQRLVVALSTVKKHLNNINTKLDTQSRTQALARARELNLV